MLKSYNQGDCQKEVMYANFQNRVTLNFFYCIFPHIFKRCRGSSVVERVIGNDEVDSSILSRGTIYKFFYFNITRQSKRVHEWKFDALV
tara:strand:+ start:1801 stop:2067 length:267 start_codon:yes stop_codon:yes gene_type:complete